MERNIRLVVAYDGTDFHGWQSQPGVRTVQEEIEAAAQRIVNHPVSVSGASRTDAGVHARGQVARLRTGGSIPVDSLRRALRDRLPVDIALLHVTEMPRDFHPSLHARGKLYRYRLYHSQRRPAEVLATRYAWHIWVPLDLGRMQAAAATLVGTHDFAAFAGRGSPRECTVRTIRRVEIRRRYEDVLIDVEGDGFLYKQVRNIVGTLIEVGRGHWPPECVAEILAARDRARAGPTAPAHGLSLQWVRYDPHWSIPDEA